MGESKYIRKKKETKPVVAICYDFDKTLSPTDMQAQGFIQSVGYDVNKFWDLSNGIAAANDMDQNLAYMYLMRSEAAGRVLFTRQTLMDYGSRVELFPGVAEWFEMIRAYGETKGVIVEHYIISSGLKEMIDGTTIAQNGAFERVYASSFYYNEHGEAVWPAQVVNYTNKTQFLFPIEKGTLDINDPGVNDSFSPSQVRVPFRNMIYIGDSDTDIPCMKLVTAYGGHSIGVFNSQTQDKAKVYKMLRDGRIRYFVPADYTQGQELDQLVRMIIDRIAANERLEEQFNKYSAETASHDESISTEQRQKDDLMIRLEESMSFSNTHSVISEMIAIENWRNDEIEKLCTIATTNSQVSYILRDPDVSAFFSRIIDNAKTPMGQYTDEVRSILSQK